MGSETFSSLQWLKKCQEELEKIKEQSPFLLVLGVSVGIEFMGKLLSTDGIDNANSCSKKFEAALDAFPSFKKYKGKNLYKLIRCGLAHRVAVKEGIILTSSKDTDLNAYPIVINATQFYEDFKKAVDEIEKHPGLNLDATKNYVTVTSEGDTGSTTTIITYLN